MKEEHLGKGGLASPKDTRDYDWGVIGASKIPFSWELGYDIDLNISLKNQGNSSSCGGQAVSYYGEVLEAKASETVEERSAKFIYAQTAVQGGGSCLRDNCNIAVNQGWALESVLPSYEFGNPPTETFITRKEDITDIVRANAVQSRALSYAVVDRTDIDAVAQAIASNYGCVILIQGTNNGTWLSKMPNVTKSGDNTWNHFLYCGGAKMISGKKYVKARNSWGNIGENGWQWISEDFFTNGYILECRTIVFNNQPARFQFNKNLYLGMRNGDVLNLQHRLVKDGYATYEPSGYFGLATLASVIKYQKANNISPAVGYVGLLTRTALNK